HVSAKSVNHLFFFSLCVPSSGKYCFPWHFWLYPIHHLVGRNACCLVYGCSVRFGHGWQIVVPVELFIVAIQLEHCLKSPVISFQQTVGLWVVRRGLNMVHS